VIASKVEPLRHKLSRAKAYGHLMSSEPGYRSPDDLSSQISSAGRTAIRS